MCTYMYILTHPGSHAHTEGRCRGTFELALENYILNKMFQAINISQNTPLET